MKVTANRTTCVAAGNCSDVAPQVFATLEDDDFFVRVLDEQPPESEWAVAREAAFLCPSASIRIEG